MKIVEGIVAKVDVHKISPLSFFAAIDTRIYPGGEYDHSLFCSETSFSRDSGPECPQIMEKVFVDLDDVVDGCFSVYRRRPDLWVDFEEFLS